MGNSRVLIVDDDDLNVEVITAYLELDGYTCDNVMSGEEALERVQTHLPDIILMDVRMRGMNGFETTAALKADPMTQHIPVLLVTAFNDRENTEQAVAAGVDDILFKPIDSLILSMRVKSLVRIKKLYDQLNG